MPHTNYRSSDGLNDVPVSAATPLPVTIAGSATPATQVAYGAVTTAVPAYTDATNQPVSLSPSGGLRVGDLPGITGGTALLRPGVVMQIRNPVNDSPMVLTGFSNANTNQAPGNNGYLAPVLFGTYNDVSVTAMTEDNVGNIRMSVTRGLLTAAQYNATLPTKTDEQTVELQATARGALITAQVGNLFSNISTATTTTVKSGAGALLKLTVNTWLTGAVITIYDNTTATGTTIATITLPSADPGPITLEYELAFATGLTIVTSAAVNITATYR